MSKLNITFNGKKYSVAKSSLSGAIANLEAVLNGLAGGSGDSGVVLTPGLYRTGAIDLYETGDIDGASAMLETSWDELLANGTVHVEDGVVYTDFDPDECVNASSDALAGDLVLPCDGSITKMGDVYWDDSINYNEKYDYYEGGYVGHFAFPSCANLTSIIIPESVMSISECAFSACEALTSIEIPNSVTDIGGSAFENCTSLTSIVIPDSVTSIGAGAFQYCTSLTSIVIPDGVTNIDVYTFYGCELLSSTTIPDSVTSIGIEAFSYCTSLTSVTIPDSVTNIGGEAFYGCSNLTELTFEGTVDQWNAITLDGDIWADTPVFYVQCSDGQVAL
jgi:hypothetical protein